MSRVAKKPIALPRASNSASSPIRQRQGPEGHPQRWRSPPASKSRSKTACHQLSANDASHVPLTGTLRAILANMVHGVSERLRAQA
jgi:large subunit ribosomal protein L6